MTAVVLVRHGETTWNREGRIQGWAPTPLTDRGRDGARALGAHLADAYAIDRIVSSDLPRARETAGFVGGTVDAPVRFDGAWRERDFGCYQGLTYDELDTLVPASVTEVGANAAVPDPPSGESLGDLRDRVVAAWERLLAGSYPDETTLVVTHGGAFYAVVGRLKDLDVETSTREHDPSNCGVTEIRVDGEPRLVREDDTDY